MKHVWISNRAFTAITGIRWVCLNCGAGVVNRRDAPPECPGKRPVQARSTED